MKVLRAVLLAVVLSFLFGVALGTILRMRMERPVFYIGALAAADLAAPDRPESAALLRS